MLFCPYCSTLLVIDADTGVNKWACQTCPYQFPITKQMTSRTKLVRKEVEDVFSGENDFVDKAPVTCLKCEHPESYYGQLQIRSADEPMTTYAQTQHADIDGERTSQDVLRGYQPLCLSKSKIRKEAVLPDGDGDGATSPSLVATIALSKHVSLVVLKREYQSLETVNAIAKSGVE